MARVMLKPNWPGGTFRRSVGKGGSRKQLVFLAGQVTEVTKAQRKELDPLIGVNLFDAEVDDKGRVRAIDLDIDETETTEIEPAADSVNMEQAPNDENV